MNPSKEKKEKGRQNTGHPSYGGRIGNGVTGVRVFKEFSGEIYQRMGTRGKIKPKRVDGPGNVDYKRK